MVDRTKRDLLDLLAYDPGLGPMTEMSVAGRSVTPEMRSLDPSMRDHLATILMGDERVSPEYGRVVEGLTGSRGLSGTSGGGFGLIDMTPAGIPLAFEEAEGNAQLQAMALFPGSRKAAQAAKEGAQSGGSWLGRILGRGQAPLLMPNHPDVPENEARAALTKLVERELDLAQPRQSGQRLPPRPIGVKHALSDFDPAAVRAEVARQQELRSALPARVDPDPEPPLTTPQSAPMPDNPADFLTVADRDAILAATSERQRLAALQNLDQQRESRLRAQGYMQTLLGPDLPTAQAASPATRREAAVPPAELTREMPTTPIEGQQFPPRQQPNVATDPSQASPSPIPQEPRYTRAHSKIAQDAFQQVFGATGTGFAAPTQAERSAAVSALQAAFRAAGLEVPSASNLNRRLGSTVQALVDFKRAGADIADPRVVRRAFGGPGQLAVPLAIGAGAAMSDEEQRRALIEALSE